MGVEFSESSSPRTWFSIRTRALSYFWLMPRSTSEASSEEKSSMERTLLLISWK